MILIIFVASLYLLFTGLRKIKAEIRKQLKELKKFDTSAAIDRKDFVEIQQLFANKKILYHQWREFEECVVIDRLSDGREEYRNTIAASKFFNLKM